MDYDVILIHPPAVYDFREKAIFPGPIAFTVKESTSQFIVPPVGMLSIADYLDRKGYKVIVDNIGERMVSDNSFNTESYINNLSARVYAIGLHWCVHSQGAIEIARLCKKLHPDSMVLLGGLTATVFHKEIISRYTFVDAVIRAEAEKPFADLMNALEHNIKFGDVPNLTFRESESRVVSNKLMEPSSNLDEFEFTRLDLLEPKQSIFTPGMPAHWGVPICRGCLHNCVSCGGSSYSYKTYLGRKKPAFRSPKKIMEDLHKLDNQGVELAFLFQDPRMGGDKYWRGLLRKLNKEKFNLIQITMELFDPANEEYIHELSKIGTPIVLTISPESCVEKIRKTHGRKYTNNELLKTIELCKQHDISLGVILMIPIGDDTPDSISKSREIWEEICLKKFKGTAPVHYSFGPMILLDPGSLAFDFPDKHSYCLVFKNFEDYLEGMSFPSWHQWISYETKFLDRSIIAEQIIDSIKHSIDLSERYGLCTGLEAESARLLSVTTNKLIIGVVDKTMSIGTEEKRMKKLKDFREYLDKNLPHQA